METTTTLACKPASYHRLPKLVLALLSLAVLSACALPPDSTSQNSQPQAQSGVVSTSASLPNPLPHPAAPVLVAKGKTITGVASWYSVGCGGGHRTCTGEYFDGEEMTAASRVIPLGSRVRVTLVGNPSRSVVVRVNDYMPYRGRVLDLSKAAAEKLGIISEGIARVRVQPVVQVAANTP